MKNEGCNGNYRNNSKIQTLKFVPFENHVIPQVVETSFDLIIEETFNGHKAILFKTNAESDIFGGIFLHDTLYSLGPVSMNSTPMELLSISETNVFNKKLIKFSGVLGFNNARTLYIDIQDDKFIAPFLDTDGNATEIDLDNDNVKEIVTTVGTIPNTSVYRIVNGKIVVANINKSINAKAVLFNKENKQFQIYLEPNKEHLYFFTKGWN